MVGGIFMGFVYLVRAQNLVRVQNFPKKLIFFSLLIRKRTCACKRIRGGGLKSVVSFSENFAYVLNE